MSKRAAERTEADSSPTGTSQAHHPPTTDASIQLETSSGSGGSRSNKKRPSGSGIAASTMSGSSSAAGAVGAGDESDIASPTMGPPAKKSRTNTPWTPAEEQRLKTMRDAGNSWADIAKTFPSRTEGSVKKHWYKDMHYAEFAEDEVREEWSSERLDLLLMLGRARLSLTPSKIMKPTSGKRLVRRLESLLKHASNMPRSISRARYSFEGYKTALEHVHLGSMIDDDSQTFSQIPIWWHENSAPIYFPALLWVHSFFAYKNYGH